MLGFDKHTHAFDPATLPIFVHTLHDAEAFGLVQQIWEHNSRYVMLDAANHKELMRFVFNEPGCVVWLERNQGRTDAFELVLLWDDKGDKQGVSEVYVLLPGISEASTSDDKRIKSLLGAILTTPAVVPVNAARQQQATGKGATEATQPPAAQDKKQIS